MSALPKPFDFNLRVQSYVRQLRVVLPSDLNTPHHHDVGHLELVVPNGDLSGRISKAAGVLWPSSLGNTIQIGDQGSIAQEILTTDMFRNLLVADSDPALPRARQDQVGAVAPEIPFLFAALCADLITISDNTADTVIGTSVLTTISDTRTVLTRIHQILKVGGQAVFMIPNRRYYQALCLEMAKGFARDGRWLRAKFRMLGEIRKSLWHGGHSEASHPLPVRQLFLSDLLEDLGREIGFASIDMLPLNPDPVGGQTISRLLREAGASAEFEQEFGSLAAIVGRPYLSLLDPRDTSAFSVAWFTEAAGPFVRRFTDSQVRPPPAYVGSNSAAVGLMPRWSVELRARDTENGVVVSIGGWCLANIDAVWVRLTVDSVEQRAAIYHARPDVHEVLNRSHVYHPLPAICSGVIAELLFADVRPGTEGCLLRIEMSLAGGLMVTGPSPSWLKLDQPTVIAH